LLILQRGTTKCQKRQEEKPKKLLKRQKREVLIVLRKKADVNLFKRRLEEIL